MSFEVSAQAYGAFMGRFAEPLAVRFADACGVAAGMSALDVGCGPGALTAVLVDRLGTDAVAAVDPSEPFVRAVRARLPGIDARLAGAEELPYGPDRFDAVLAQLVVHFMSDPVGGLAEMARVARPGGAVAATAWDHGGGRGPLAAFWTAARALDPDLPDESGLPGVQEGGLEALFASAGITGCTSTVLEVEVRHASFEQWWHPFTLGVGPAGDHVAGLAPGRREELRSRCAAALPQGAFSTRALAWTVIGRAGR